MIEFKKYRNNMLPMLLAIGLIAFIIVGAILMQRNYTIQINNERSTQLQQVSKQIQMNFSHGMEIHWNIAECIDKAIEGKKYASEEELIADIGYQKEAFNISTYSCTLMLLDDNGIAHLSTGEKGVWDDVGRLADGKSRHTFVSETSSIDGRYVAFVRKLDEPVTAGGEDNRFTHMVMLKDIESLRKYYTTDAYENHAATYIIKSNGVLAYYDSDEDIIGARNIMKFLNSAEYTNDQSFEDVKKCLNKESIASASIKIGSEEYCYCITALADFDMTIMLLVPSEYVAVSTSLMFKSFVRVAIVFAVVLLLLAAVVIVAFLAVSRKNEMVRIEKDNNHKLLQLKNEADEARRAAEVASKSKSTFLSNMSHDIRTPMNAIIGFATLASDNIDNREKLSDYISKILSSSRHLLNLINDILDMSRIESGRLELQLEETSLTSIVDDIRNMIGEEAAKKKIDISFDTDGIRDNDVVCDRTRLCQVLLNLVSNAVKYTGECGKVSTIIRQLDCEETDAASYEIRVRDNGIGMSEEFAARIFEPFERERSSTVSRIQGTGLGMSITKSILDMMGGDVSVVTQEGEGSEFTVHLKLGLSCSDKESGSAPNHAPAEASVTDDVKVSFEGKRVLLAEDNELNREIAVTILEGFGFIVDSVIDGSEALERVADSAPDTYDLVLMDVQMPVMDGYEASSLIRGLENKQRAEIPIVVMTANAFEDDRRRAMAAGMDGFITKPISIDEIVTTISEVLKKTAY
ncbi:MAG: hybrid sensor histidine kinase/response regulator [Anaerovoracaceae bacterium]